MKQTRFIPIEDCGLQIRETEFGQGKSRTVVGRPVMFGVRSVNLTPWSDTRVVYEILEPNCITQELINRSNVVYNNNHSNDISDMIGRCVNGKGTLSLVLRENYMESSCDYPNTTVANDTLEHIRLGNVYGMSFAFDDRNANGEENVTYERTNETVDGKEVWLRHVWLITKLFDVANVTHPAYEQTSVATREMSEAIDKAIEEQLKREAAHQETDEEREAREKAEREAAEREANGGETNAEKAEREAREQAEREANGGETNAEKEARRIAEEETRMKAEALAREEAARKEKQLQEERKQREILSRKRKLGFSRNSVQQDYCNKELAREDWNKDYVDYLQSQFINVNDVAGFTEEELTAPIMNREEFEQQQAVELYREKATRAGELWDMALNQLSGSAHKWKWDYMDYLEGIKYRDTADVTLEEAREEILSYEEFAELNVAEEEIQVQASEMVAISVDTTDEVQVIVVS